MKNLPLGIQTFSKIVTDDYIYVDKTKDIYNLFIDGGQYYFLSRPRRFGKSLLISTLSELFAGNRELFKGLWIEDKIEWKKHPVIHIDFTTIDYENDDLLKESLTETLDKIGSKYGIQLTTVSYKTRFGELIERLSADGKVVILIDEYDKPIIDLIGKREVAEANRKILANFYSIIKSSDQYIEFAFLTGVSKFSKVSVFSGLNNLRDITLSKQFATLLGCTQEELLFYFSAHLDRLSKESGITREPLVEKVKEWYNGYSWDGENLVYNPFSIINLFKENVFKNYWFSTGTPTFLVKLAQQHAAILPVIENLPVSDYAFDSYDIDHMTISPLLFQTGYLTIKKITVKDDENRYHLDYPNREVRQSFLKNLFREFTRQDGAFSSRMLERISEKVKADDLEGLLQETKSVFAAIPYHIFIDERESYYHTVVYLILKLSGARILSEDPTNLGRMDAVLETEKRIYIMEFKMGSEQEALAQIKEKGYHEKYMNSGKEIILAGISFDPEKRNIGVWTTETIPLHGN